jgi:hypothetical protein
MAKDTKALAAAHAPDAALGMEPKLALELFEKTFGFDPAQLTDNQAQAHRLAEYALKGNAAFVNAFREMLEGGLGDGGKLAKLAPAQRALVDEFHAFSDLVGSATQLKLGGGHGRDYYEAGIDIGGGYTSRNAAESWAGWWQLHTSPNRGWEALVQKYLPETDQASRALLERLIKQTR